MKKIPVYFLMVYDENVYGKVYGDTAFIDEAVADEYLFDNLFNKGQLTYVCSTKLPYVSKYVYHVRLYRGFDYSIERNGRYDVVNQNQTVYQSIEAAKQEDDLWQLAKLAMEKNPNKFIVTDTKIVSKDDIGNEWIEGDIIEDRFRAEICKLKIIRKRNNEITRWYT